MYLFCFVALSPFVRADGHITDAKVSFYSEIVPLLKRSCQGCHHPGDPNGDLIVTTYEALKQGGMAGDAIVPGKPDESLLIELISGDEPAMPQNMEPLSTEEVELFRRWILEGAHDDTPDEVDDMGEGKLPDLHSAFPWLPLWHIRLMVAPLRCPDSAKFCCMTQRILNSNHDW